MTGTTSTPCSPVKAYVGMHFQFRGSGSDRSWIITSMNEDSVLYERRVRDVVCTFVIWRVELRKIPDLVATKSQRPIVW